MRLIYSLGGATLQARLYFIATAVRRSHSFLLLLLKCTDESDSVTVTCCRGTVQNGHVLIYTWRWPLACQSSRGWPKQPTAT